MTEQDQGLEVHNLKVARDGKLVVHGLSLSLRPGEISALIGANGAGKSSTVMALAGAIPVASGTVNWQGREITNQPADRIRRQGIALVPEGHPVLGALSVLDNLRAAASHLPPGEVAAAVDRALALFPELTLRLQVPAAALSGGQKQMVLLGQAIISGPRLLLIDELSLGLAPAVVTRLADTLVALASEGIGILLIEQFTTLALKLAPRAYVMERGRLIYAGSSEELRQNDHILHSAYLAG
ncbi:MAG: ABC transporter ATP-binding protein [Rhodobacteraceae bacterium]|nr:ABC transporter ATP-binding protein [Paracoccaceae bacterium]